MVTKYHFWIFLFWWVKRKKMLKWFHFFQLYSMIGVLRLLLAQDKLPKPFDKNWIAHMMDHRSGLYVSYFLSILSDVLSQNTIKSWVILQKAIWHLKLVFWSFLSFKNFKFGKEMISFFVCQFLLCDNWEKMRNI